MLREVYKLYNSEPCSFICLIGERHYRIRLLVPWEEKQLQIFSFKEIFSVSPPIAADISFSGIIARSLLPNCLAIASTEPLNLGCSALTTERSGDDMAGDRGDRVTLLKFACGLGCDVCQDGDRGDKTAARNAR